ncbi:extracellular solute-binding protein [Curtobacterium flaccumfaciens]|nr:extracellular solute-binding protein [Curtobacterium flaccumfaciens]
MWCRSATQAGLTSAVAGFNKANPELQVQLTPVPDAQYVTKLATAIRGGEPPDVVDIDDINSQLFIFREAFADLTDVVKSLDYFDAISPGHLRLLEYRDRYYGLPYLADNSQLFVNTELFERAGLDVEESTRDLSTLLDAAKAIRKLDDDVYGWSISGNAAGIIGFVTQPHVWATGVDMMTGEVGSQRPNITGNEALGTHARVLPAAVEGRRAVEGDVLRRRHHVGCRLPGRQGGDLPDLVQGDRARGHQGDAGEDADGAHPCRGTASGRSSTAATTCASRTGRRTRPVDGRSCSTRTRSNSSRHCRTAGTSRRGPTPPPRSTASGSRWRTARLTPSRRATRRRRWRTTCSTTSRRRRTSRCSARPCSGRGALPPCGRRSPTTSGSSTRCRPEPACSLVSLVSGSGSSRSC